MTLWPNISFVTVPAEMDKNLCILFAGRWAWPLYWLAQGTMFWALFVVGHDWWDSYFSPQCSNCSSPLHYDHCVRFTKPSLVISFNQHKHTNTYKTHEKPRGYKERSYNCLSPLNYDHCVRFTKPSLVIALYQHKHTNTYKTHEKPRGYKERSYNCFLLYTKIHCVIFTKPSLSLLCSNTRTAIPKEPMKNPEDIRSAFTRNI